MNGFDRDPVGMYRKAHSMIDQDEKSGYLSKSEIRRLRSAANRLYLKGKSKNGGKN